MKTLTPRCVWPGCVDLGVVVRTIDPADMSDPTVIYPTALCERHNAEAIVRVFGRPAPPRNAHSF